MIDIAKPNPATSFSGICECARIVLPANLKSLRNVYDDCTYAPIIVRQFDVHRIETHPLK